MLNYVIVKCVNGRRACLYEAINGLECLCGRFQPGLPGWISGRLFTWLWPSKSIMQGIICEFSSFGSKWRFILALASTEWYSVTNDTTHANRFQGNARFTKIIHPGKPGWNVGMRIFQPALPRYCPAQTGISASGTARLLIKRTKN